MNELDGVLHIHNVESRKAVTMISVHVHHMYVRMYMYVQSQLKINCTCKSVKVTFVSKVP